MVHIPMFFRISLNGQRYVLLVFQYVGRLNIVLLEHGAADNQVEALNPAEACVCGDMFLYEVGFWRYNPVIAIVMAK